MMRYVGGQKLPFAPAKRPAAVKFTRRFAANFIFDQHIRLAMLRQTKWQKVPGGSQHLADRKLGVWMKELALSYQNISISGIGKIMWHEIANHELFLNIRVTILPSEFTGDDREPLKAAIVRAFNRSLPSDLEERFDWGSPGPNAHPDIVNADVLELELRGPADEAHSICYRTVAETFAGILADPILIADVESS